MPAEGSAPPVKRSAGPKNPPAPAAEPAPKNPKGGRPTKDQASAEERRIHGKLEEHYATAAPASGFYRGRAVAGAGYVPASFGGERQNWAEEAVRKAEAEHGKPKESETYPVPTIEGREHLQDRRSTKTKAAATTQFAPVVSRPTDTYTGAGGGSNLQGANAILQGTGRAYSSPHREPTMTAAPKNQTTKQPKRKKAAEPAGTVAVAHEKPAEVESSDREARRQQWEAQFAKLHSPQVVSELSKQAGASMPSFPSAPVAPRTPEGRALMADVAHSQLARGVEGHAAEGRARRSARARTELAHGGPQATPAPASKPRSAKAPSQNGSVSEEQLGQLAAKFNRPK